MRIHRGIFILTILLGQMFAEMGLQAQCQGYLLQQVFVTSSSNATMLYQLNPETGETDFVNALPLNNGATFGLVDVGDALITLVRGYTSGNQVSLIRMDYEGQILNSVLYPGITGNEGDLHFIEESNEILVLSVGSPNFIYSISLDDYGLSEIGVYESSLNGISGDPSGIAVGSDGEIYTAERGANFGTNQGIVIYRLDIGNAPNLTKTNVVNLTFDDSPTLIGMDANSCEGGIQIAYGVGSGFNSYTFNSAIFNPATSTIDEFNIIDLPTPDGGLGISGLSIRSTPCDKVEVPQFKPICTANPGSEVISLNISDGGQGGTWFGSGFFANPNSPMTTVSGFGYGDNVIEWVDNCDQNTYQVTITLLEAPELILEADPSFTVCGGEEVIVSATPNPAGTMFTYSNCQLGGVYYTSPSNTFNAGSSYSGNIGVQAVYPNGCRVFSCEEIVRKDCCDDVFIPQDMSFCELKATYVEIDLMGSDGGEGGFWTSSDSGVQFDDNTQINTTADEFEFGLTTLTWYDTCRDEEYSFTVEILETIDFSITASDMQLCDDELVTLSVPASIQGVIGWGLCGLPPQVREALPGAASWTPGGQGSNTSYQATIYLDNGCVVTECIDVFWRDCDCPDADQVDVPDMMVCPGAFPVCIEAPAGFVMVDARFNDAQIPNFTAATEYCTSDYGVYAFEFQNAASGCTYVDLVEIIEDPDCCELFPDFTVSEPFPIFCQYLVVSDNSTAGANTEIVGHTWNYGNGQPLGVGANPQGFAYQNDGTYTIELTVAGIDSQGNCCTATTSQDVVIDCVCGVTSSFTSTVTDCNVFLTATSTLSPQTNFISHEWDMGDGTILYGNTVAYTYASSGNYTITLVTQGSSGSTICSDETSQTISANCDGTVFCDLSGEVLYFSSGNLDVFYSILDSGEGTTILGRQWTLDGVDSGSGESLVLSPGLVDGTYQVCLTVIAMSEGQCCIVEICETFTIGSAQPGQPGSGDDNERKAIGSSPKPTMKLAPNPASDYASVLISQTDKDIQWQVQLFDGNARLVSADIEAIDGLLRIKTDDLGPGVYTVLAQCDRTTLVETLIVE